MTNTPRSNAISPVVLMGSGGTDLTSQEQVERLAKRLDGAQCTSGCGTMKFCICAYAADCVDTLRALSAERDALKEKLRHVSWMGEGYALLESERDALKAELAEAVGVMMPLLDYAENGVWPDRDPIIAARAFLASLEGYKP